MGPSEDLSQSQGKRKTRAEYPLECPMNPDESGALSGWDNLVEELAARDIRYLTHDMTPAQTAIGVEGQPRADPDDGGLRALVLGLVQAPETRLRDALPVLLVRHPEYAPAVEGCHTRTARVRSRAISPAPQCPRRGRTATGVEFLS